MIEEYRKMSSLSRKLVSGALFLSLVIGPAGVVGIAAAQNDAPLAQAQAPYLGIYVQPDTNGVRVMQVEPNSPAAAAGLLTDDLITAVGGESVDGDSLAETVRQMTVGDTLDLTVERDGESLDLSATLAARPEGQAPQPFTQPFPANRPFLGVRLEDGDDGAAITEVQPGSPAETAGLQVGDVILSVDDTDTADSRAVAEAIAGYEQGDTVTLMVQHGDGGTQTLDVTLGSVPAPQIGRDGNFGFNFDQLESLTFDAEAGTWTIGAITENTPLYDAGLREGDVITQINGQTFNGDNPLDLGQSHQGDTVTLTVERDGETQDIDVPNNLLPFFIISGQGGFPFQAFPGQDGGRDFGQGEMPFGAIPFGMPGMMSGGFLGVEFVTLDATNGADFNTDATEGAVITNVLEDSPAAEAGLETNDVVTAVNNEPINEEWTLRDRLSAYEAGDTVTLTVTHEGEDASTDIDVTLGEPNADMMQGMMPFNFSIPALPNGVPAQPGQPPVPAQPNI
jgi:S1-C subfamily serine protease